MRENTSNQDAFIWSLADLLRSDFKQGQYGRIILPFTLLRLSIHFNPRFATHRCFDFHQQRCEFVRSAASVGA